MQNISEGRELPEKWDVRLYWRNPKTRHGVTKKWRYDNFSDAIAESRSGFGDIVYSALRHQLNAFKTRQAVAKKLASRRKK